MFWAGTKVEILLQVCLKGGWLRPRCLREVVFCNLMDFMNYLWGGMLLAGICYGALTGTLNEVTNGILQSAKEAVTLAIGLLGITAFWSGLMKIARSAGILEWMTKKLRPCLHFLFPKIPKEHPVLESISVNMIANIFGLGAAATPAGLKAMEELEALEEERRQAYSGQSEGIRSASERNAKQKQEGKQKRRLKTAAGTPVPKGTANREMCTFLILNISSLQLIPVSVIAYRSQYGSVNPTAVTAPAIAATAFSTLAAVLFCKLADSIRK